MSLLNEITKKIVPGTRHDIYDQCTLYDCVNRYGWTMGELLGNYPIWDETRREWLNGMIYDQFAIREIGPETPALFAHYAKNAMWRIMPRVNNIAAFALEGSENWDRSFHEVTESEGQTTDQTSGTGSNTVEREGSSTRTPNTVTTTESETESKATALVSDTPQAQLSGLENYMSGLNESGSAGTASSTVTATGTETDASESTDTATSATSAQSTGTTQATTTHDVYAGQLSELASKWAETMPDILGLIFAGLESCFSQVF